MEWLIHARCALKEPTQLFKMKFVMNAHLDTYVMVRRVKSIQLYLGNIKVRSVLKVFTVPQVHT
jgi:hypothetical protein